MSNLVPLNQWLARTSNRVTVSVKQRLRLGPKPAAESPVAKDEGRRKGNTAGQYTGVTGPQQVLASSSGLACSIIGAAAVCASQNRLTAICWVQRVAAPALQRRAWAAAAALLASQSSPLQQAACGRCWSRQLGRVVLSRLHDVASLARRCYCGVRLIALARGGGCGVHSVQVQAAAANSAQH